MAIGKPSKGTCDWCGQTRVLKLVKIAKRAKSKGLRPDLNVCSKCEDRIKTWLKDET